MKTTLHRTAGILMGWLLVVGAAHAWAAKAPVSSEKMSREAAHIVSGTVVKVTARTQKSQVETAPGDHVDRVFHILVKVKAVAKGGGVKVGDEIEVVAWQAARRNPPLAGWQGHDSIPQKGDSVKLYLVRKGADGFEPIMPNGMVIEKDAR